MLRSRVLDRSAALNWLQLPRKGCVCCQVLQYLPTLLRWLRRTLLAPARPPGG
jgi:hypothetical protein